MKYANLNGKLIAATIHAPATATCIHCGLRVELRLAAGMQAPHWGHVTPAEAVRCERERLAETKG